jgi:peptidoglycan/LPS O-acetylase OafA/YrhL
MTPDPTPTLHDVVPGRRDYRLLDGVRAIAALMVVGYHAHARSADATGWDPAAHLNMGVTVFFVLSGFLLYRPFVDARLRGARPPRVGSYLRRRFFRVVPAYWVAITVLGLALPAYVPVLSQDWPLYYSLTQTWDPDTTFGGLAPAWSLSVEVAFYLLLPAVAAGLHRLLGGRRPAAQARAEFGLYAGVVVLTSIAFRFVLDRGDGPLGFLTWTILGHLDWFAGGMALALASALWERRPVDARPWVVRFAGRRPTTCWLAAAALFAVVGFVDGNPGNVVHIASLLVAVLLVVPAVFGDDRGGPIRAFLGSRAMSWLGTISYGIFLWNEPFAGWSSDQSWIPAGPVHDVLVFFLAAAAAIVLGAASFYLVERPLIRVSRRSRSAGDPAAEGARAPEAPSRSRTG